MSQAAPKSILIYGDTFRCPELRHELPLLVPDPFLYVETVAGRHAVLPPMEIPRVREVSSIECHSLREFGFEDFVEQGFGRARALEETWANAVRSLGVEEATVPYDFPAGLAERLRDAGVALTVDSALFARRRRVKTPAELAGIRRAQRAAEAGMAAARSLLATASSTGGELSVQRIKSEIHAAFLAHGCMPEESIVSHGAQAARGHDLGSEKIVPGEPVIIDLWPRDTASGCYADMTRTFCIGQIPSELRAWHALVRESLEQARQVVRAGVPCRAVYDASCEPLERAGHPTQRTKERGADLEEGFYHGLGHGVGLATHEEPVLGISSKEVLVAGDVITLEPGTYRQGFGGVRLEDLVLVEEHGATTLTDFPYDLEP